MSIRRFFDQNVVMRRLSTVSGHRKQFQSTATVEGHIQEMSREARQRLGIIEERSWYIWVDVDANINEGDVLIDKDGKEYKVKEVTTKDYGVNQHRQCIIEEANE